MLTMYIKQLFITFLLSIMGQAIIQGVSGVKSFGINREKQCFWKDNSTCFQYISGSLHYTRIPYQYWEDRLMKARAAGLNTIQTYVPWNSHEPEPGKYNFDGMNNIAGFLGIAQKLGLYVLLRPGPYVCAAIDMGGFPYWLLRDNPNMLLRTSDPSYLSKVKSWFDVLLPKIKPYLYKYGGPILMVQIENEYGSYYACDRNYTAYLRDLVWFHLGNDTQLYTTDGNSGADLKCGVIPGVYPTVDFGTLDSIGAVNASFIAQRNYSGPGPLVNSEYYLGWLDQWGDSGHHTVNVNRSIRTMKEILSFNASVNIYMMHGGTNFGYSSGAEGSDGTSDKAYSSATTSYDYDAPISEAGDPTPKLFAIRSLIENITGMHIPYPVPNATQKIGYGSFKLKKVGNIIELLSRLSPGYTNSRYPPNAEQLGHGYGFILYVVKLSISGSRLNVSTVHDRAYFIRNGVQYLGLLERNINSTIAPKGGFEKGDIIHILLENRGRIIYGSWINDSKGISNVTLDGHILTNWIIYPIILENYFNPSLNGHSNLEKTKVDLHLNSRISTLSQYLPSVYVGTLKTTDVADTFFDPTNWGKGQLLINGFNLGRYWPDIGPQQTLYVPRFYLKNGTTTVMLLELETPGNCIESDQNICFASFTNVPQLNKPGGENIEVVKVPRLGEL